MQGKQQQRAIPIKHARTTQKMAKNTSNARNTTANLQYPESEMPGVFPATDNCMTSHIKRDVK